MALASPGVVREEIFPADVEINSPSVGILSKRFPGPGKCQVLDLGAPVESNVEFFATGPCRIHIEDLYRFFIAPEKGAANVDDETDSMSAGLARALDFDDRARFDLVLAWDLFSYMEPRAIELLMSRVARSCRAGALLFLANSTAASIPAVPARIAMSRLGRMRYQNRVTDARVSNPRYSPIALEGMMPGFRLLHSFLLGENMQEFLFSFA